MNNLHLYLIVNEEAGSGNCRKQLPILIEQLTQLEIEHTVLRTEYAGHAVELAQELGEGLLRVFDETVPRTVLFPLLVVVGGDGTLHEVVNGLTAVNKDIPFAYLPCGSGNDFARGTGISRNLKTALQQIITCQLPQKVNVLRYDEKIQEKQGILVNNFGTGLDAAVVAVTNDSESKKQLNKYKAGSFAYIISIIKVLFLQKGFPIVLSVNGKQMNFKKTFLCTVTNHPYFGGGIPIAPDESPFKSDMEIVIVERIAIIKILYLIVRLFQKKHLRSKYVFHEKADEIRILSTTGQYGQTDGETWDKRAYDIKLTTESRWLWAKLEGEKE